MPIRNGKSLSNKNCTEWNKDDNYKPFVGDLYE